jgi:hypothetical protein
MKEEALAHLVPAPGVLRALPAVCGERISSEDFWEKAKKKTLVCKTCKRLLRETQSREGVVARTASGRKKS